jgi:molybdopterin biosynthesis enzyme
MNRRARPHFIRATLEKRDGKWLARPLPNQGSQVISSIANCLVEVAEASTLPRGMAVKVLLIR